jgi:hypothetical protein
MYSPDARNTRWLRRATTLAAAAGLVLISSLAPAAAVTLSTAAQQTGSVQQTGSACPHPTAPRLGETVTGPHMYVPGTPDSLYPCASTVTVSQTRDLVNQMVQVSWTGFTPTKSIPFTQGIPYSNLNSLYPVEVAECQGTSPGTSPTDLGNPHCYWAANFGQPYTNGKYGPGNATWATTTAQGTGYLDVQVETTVQNQGLGCTSTRPCSLLILPAQGGIPGDPAEGIKTACSDHRQDKDSSLVPYATAQATFVLPGGLSGDTCSWPDRIVVPLHFAPQAKNCGFRNPAFSVAGSPLMERAMTSWQSGLCQGAHPDPYSWDGSVAEPQARSIFSEGGDDNVALTTDPGTGPTRNPYTYAPVGITSAAVAYWVDDDKTGEPYTNLKLTPLLLTKMLTQSYEYGSAAPGYACTPAELQNPPTTPPGCDAGTLHDPQNVLTDPEFRQLNPGLRVDETQTATVGIPTVQSGNSDMTWEVTRWIAANQASTSFLAGHVDDWGEHVNTYYLGTHYPTDQFVAQDPTGPVAYTYLPVYPPQKVATYQADNWFPDNSWLTQDCVGSTEQCPIPFNAETPGERQLFAILDEPDASAFMMPTMKIENGAGDYVAPSKASMTAALKNMVANGRNGITQDYNEASKDAAAYPLTMVVYAMVPTGGISHQMATKIAQWLDYAAGPGQHEGMLPGQLPPGYLPLTASMRAQTRKAAYEVLHQTGGHSSSPAGHGGSHPGGGGSKNPGSSSPGSKNSPGSSTATSSPGGPNKTTANAAFASPFSGSGGKVLIILLIVGVLLAIAGPAAVVLGKPSGRAAVAAGWHRVLALRHRPRILRGGKP